MDPSSSISSSDSGATLATDLFASWKARERTPGPKHVALFAIAFLVSACYAVMNPDDLIRGNFSIDASIRTMYAQNTVMKNTYCVATPDGLLQYLDETPAASEILLVGDSTSYWNRFPQAVERISAKRGRRIALYNASQGGAKLFEMVDTLAYILAHNGRSFDAAVLKPGFATVREIAAPPEQAYDFPEIGTGDPLRFRGSPVGSTRRSFLDHFVSTFHRRRNELALVRRNAEHDRFVEHTKPGPDVTLPVRIPGEMRPAVKKFEKHVSLALKRAIEICRVNKVPLILMTTGSAKFDPEGKRELKWSRNYPAFRHKFSLLCLDHALIDRMNDVVRRTARAERVPVIDSAAYIEIIDHYRLFSDIAHIDPKEEEGHGEFILNELTSLGI